MANAKKCDICGGYYPHHFHEINGIAYLYDQNYPKGSRLKRNSMDCCPDCMIRINALIDQIRKENGLDREGNKAKNE